MSEEPKKDIEQHLERWARQRREEAGEPFKLHPATRGMLHGEVKRKHDRGGKTASEPLSWLAGLWPRFALVGAIFAVLVVGVWLLVPPAVQHSKSSQLARRAEPSADKSQPIIGESGELENSVPADELGKLALMDGSKPSNDMYRRYAPVSATASLRENLERVPNRKDSFGVSVPEADAALSSGTISQFAGGTSISPPISAPLQSPKEEAVWTSPEIATTSPPPEQLAAPEPASRSFRPQTIQSREKSPSDAGRFQAETSRTGDEPVTGFSVATPAAFQYRQRDADLSGPDSSSINAQQFVRTEAVLKNESVTRASANLGALRNFKLQQSATNLQVIDSDGSVYAGYLQATTGAEDRRAFSDDSKQAPSLTLSRSLDVSIPSQASSQTATQIYYFNVSGTNVSLRQPVIFTGRLVTTPVPAMRGVPVSAATGPSEATLSGGIPQVIPLRQSQISGRALVGADNELKVEAVATPE